MILLPIAVLILTTASGSKLDFDIHVLEKQSRFVQKVQTDLNTDHVYYATPAHNDVLESHRLQDFTKGIQLTCMPALRECHMMAIDQINYPNAGNTTEAIVHMWNKGVNSIVDETAHAVEQRVILTGREILNTAFLSKDMRDMLAKFGFPLYKVKPIPAGATVERFPAYDPLSSHVRRQTGEINELRCSNKAAPEKKYGYTTGKSCDHLYLCRGTPHAGANGITCDNRHITTSLFYKCLCCPGYFTLHDTKHCQCFRFDV